MNDATDATMTTDNIVALIRNGIARQNAGDFAAAEQFYRRALQIDPEQPDALHLLGLIAQQAGRSATAIDLLRYAIKINPRNPDYHHNLGIIYEMRGQVDAAIISNQRALCLKPDFFGARFSLANQLRTAGRLEESVIEYHNALAIDDSSAQTQSNLGSALEALGRHDEAVICFQKASELAPGNAQILSNLGMALQSAGKIDKAIDCYRKAVQADVSLPAAQVNLAEALLEKGEIEESLSVTRRCLENSPGNMAAFALLVIAAHRIGDTGQRDRLLDFDLVDTVAIDPPAMPPNPDQTAALELFNTKLASHALNHPSLRFEPVSKSTRMGRQSGELLAEPKGPVAHLETQIRGAVSDYIARIPANSQHPFHRLVPGDWRLAIWATILERKGRQLPHIHPSAWLSGVYYVQVPEQDHELSNEGWLEFGCAPENLVAGEPMPTRLMEPVPGTMYLFPSYFYHRTIPFAGDEPRISIAFDVVPVSANQAISHLSKGQADSLVEQGRAHFKNGNRAQAEDAAYQVLAQYPDHDAALHLLAKIARADGRLREVADYLRRAIDIDPGNGTYHWELSDTLHLLQLHEESAAELETALSLGVSDPRIHTQLGSALADKGEFDKALAEFAKASEDPSTVGSAFYGMSLISGFDQDPSIVERMENALKNADIGNRERVNLLFALARTMANRKDYDRAFALFSEANELRHREKPFDL